MAARRLIIVLVALFAVSIVAAMIAPDRRGGLIGGSTSTTERTTTTTTTTSTSPDRVPSGAALSARIEASAAKPETVAGDVGDQLELTVASRRAREIEIPAFGVTEDAAPAAPARFNLLLREPGRLPIIDADTGELLGRLDVLEPKDERHASGPGESGDGKASKDGG